MTTLRLPTIAVLGTGGTIASTASDSVMLTDYKISESTASLLAAIPGIDKLANVRCQQLFNMGSTMITNSMVLRLAKRVNKLLADPSIDGIVITHGTDTLEESAYFLNLTVKSTKPVVVVGAMRPASTLSPDGPLNLYNAILLASCPQAHHQGILVVFNDCIHAARFVAKTNTTQLEAFQSPDQGRIGHIYNKQVQLFQTSARDHTTKTEFDISTLDSLPDVDIIYDHQSAGRHLYEASVAAKVRGIVIAGCGNGNLSPQAKKGVRLAARAKILCVRSSRTGSGVVSPCISETTKRLISANSLNPQKARILLMLALSKSNNAATVQSYFDRY